MKVLFGEEAKDENNIEVLKMFKDEFFKHGGIEVKRVENVIEKYINTKKFFASNINYGLVTVNLKKKKPLFLTKDKITEDKLTAYLMASASCYPAFKQKEIDHENYIDGGIIDNLPINLAIDLGADEIIAVDLNAPGIKLPKKKNIPVTTIKPNNELSFFLNFNEEGAKRNMLLGYNDTMKKFKKLDGKTYTFKKGHIDKCQRRYRKIYEAQFKNILKRKKIWEQIITTPMQNKIRNKKYLLTLMEDLGKMFELDETIIYSYRNFNYTLKRKVEKELVSTKKKSKTITKLLKSKTMILDMYDKMQKGNMKAVKKEALLAPTEFLKALYLYTIYEN